MSQSNEQRIPAGLVYFEGQEKPRQYVIFNKAVLQGQCDMEVYTTSSLQLEYPFLEKEQCEIYRQDSQWIFRNLSSEVFTFVGGKYLHKDETTILHDGDVIRLSNDRMLTAVFFEHFSSCTDWQIINMDDGRHDVTIKDLREGKAGESLSLQYNNGRWAIKEFNAKELYFNGNLIREPSPIMIDDKIKVGETMFIFEGSGLVYGYPTQSGGLSIHIDERSVHKAMKKITLLKDIDLSIEPGNMVLILGGSGAGKSTFVNAVTGYEKAKATITEGGVDYYREYDQVKHRIGFVPQDNLMREEDTVGNTVKNAAEMRLPESMSADEKERRITAVLETFGLSGRENELVSKLSGGQKKRLSICMEFVASPSLFILDEPDSGLDGIMATELMENLRLIACQGKIVLVITHAPDRVAHLFDKVIVLAKGNTDKVGQLAFYGGIQEARDFFDTQTMEGVVKLINAQNEGGEGRADEFIEKFKSYVVTRDTSNRAAFQDISSVQKKSVSAESQEQQPGFDSVFREKIEYARYKGRLAQIPVYLGKLFRLFITEKNWKVLPMSAIIAALVVYVIGHRMFRNMEGTTYAALAIVCVCIWNGMFNSIQSICKERKIIKREHRTGLHITSYVLAHMIYQAFICILQVIITLAIFNIFKVYMPDKGIMTGNFVVDLGICMFLATYAADILALMVSCLVHNPTTAMTVMPFLLIIQLVFAGGIFPLNGRLAKKMSLLTISNWGISSVCSAADYNGQQSTAISSAFNLMKGDGEDLVSKLQAVMELPDVQEKVGYYTASKLQNPNFAYTKENLTKSWGILSGFTILYALIGLIFLERIDKDKR